MSNEGVIAVERALSLLDCFGPGRTSLSLAEFAEAVPLHKTTIFRLLNSLVRRNYVVKGSDGRFSLGPRALYLGTVYSTSFSIEKIVRPELHALSQESRESASFYIAAEGGRLCLYRVEPQVGLRDHILAGTVFPPDKSATGLVFENRSEFEEGRCADPMPYATDGVRDAYTASFSVPVFGAGDRFEGALTLSGPSARVRAADQPMLKRMLLQCADRIARALGASEGVRSRIYGVEQPGGGG